MKFGHISDLHLGKEMYKQPMTDDQRHILGRIVDKAKEEKLDAMLIAGDVYDTANPSNKAMKLLDGFLAELSEVCEVYLTPGNHDSAELVSYGSRFMERSGVHICGPYSGKAEKFQSEDRYGEIDIYLLPYIRPLPVRQMYPDEGIESSEDAMEATLRHSDVDPGRRNILVCHQNVCAGEKLASAGGSEWMPVGNDDALSYTLFDAFDYVALGHIHRAQSIGRDGIRYCGCPLVYDKTEIGTYKGMNIVDIGKKGEVSVREVALEPLHGWTRIEGSADELLEQSKSVPKENYVYAVLTETAENMQARLSQFCNIMHVDREYESTAAYDEAPVEVDDISKTAPEVFYRELFKKTTGRDPSEEQLEAFKDIVSAVDAGEARE